MPKVVERTEELVDLNARVPKSVAHGLKVYAVTHERTLQAVVTEALQRYRKS